MAAGKGKIVRIDALLGEMVENRNWRRNLALNRVFEFWNDAVGSDIAAHSQPKVIRGKVLWVDVTDSIWMQQLHFQKEHLREVINKRIAYEEGIEDIRFNLVNRLKPVLPEKTAAKKSPVINNPDPKKLQAFEKLISSIGEEKTRNSLRTIWLAQQGRG